MGRNTLDPSHGFRTGSRGSIYNVVSYPYSFYFFYSFSAVWERRRLVLISLYLNGAAGLGVLLSVTGGPCLGCFISSVMKSRCTGAINIW